MYLLNCILNRILNEGDPLKMIVEKLSWKFVCFRQSKFFTAQWARYLDLSDWQPHEPGLEIATDTDRKSTRLNSSHANISYAVFCLKKKKKTNEQINQYLKQTLSMQSKTT